MCVREAQHLINNCCDNNSKESRFLHYSGIYRNGKVMYTGFNHSRTTFNGKCVSFSTHAEMDVLIKLLKGEASAAI